MYNAVNLNESPTRLTATIHSASAVRAACAAPLRPLTPPGHDQPRPLTRPCGIRPCAGAGGLSHLGLPAALPDSGEDGAAVRIRRLADRVDAAALPADRRLPPPVSRIACRVEVSAQFAGPAGERGADRDQLVRLYLGDHGGRGVRDQHRLLPQPLGQRAAGHAGAGREAVAPPMAGGRHRCGRGCAFWRRAR